MDVTERREEKVRARNARKVDKYRFNEESTHRPKGVDKCAFLRTFHGP
jgi:hypothetical protein